MTDMNQLSSKATSLRMRCIDCQWRSQPKFDAWAKSGQPDSSPTCSLAMNGGHLHTCICSFLYEHQYEVLKVHLL